MVFSVNSRVPENMGTMFSLICVDLKLILPPFPAIFLSILFSELFFVLPKGNSVARLFNPVVCLPNLMFLFASSS